MRGKADAGNVTGAGSYRTKTGRRRRFGCDACEFTFSRNTGTPYYRLHTSRPVFDRVASLAVEGVSISAIARLVGRSWSTAARWLERAQATAAEFNARHIHDNFLRPHSALRFGKVTRAPAMQAGLTTKRLSFRDIFTAAAAWP